MCHINNPYVNLSLRCGIAFKKRTFSCIKPQQLIMQKP
jgi:hypothetical protein